MATLSPPTTLPLESDELLLITYPPLRDRLLKARLFDDLSARCIIQRGEQVYLSLREVDSDSERQALSWAVLRLQMGADLNPKELPEPLQTALSHKKIGLSPLIQALVWGSAMGVIGGVLVMAIVGLVVTILNIPPDSYVGVTANAVAFVLSSALIGVSTTIYFWRRFGR